MNENTTCFDCISCRHGSIYIDKEPCNSCNEKDSKFEPALPEPQPVADPDAIDLCDTCKFVFTDSSRCRSCDGRTNYTADADPDNVGAVGDVEQQAVPRRNVYKTAHDAIDRIEAMAHGIAAERIEIKVDTKRVSATVRSEDCDEVTFSRRVGEK